MTPVYDAWCDGVCDSPIVQWALWYPAGEVGHLPFWLLATFLFLAGFWIGVSMSRRMG